MAYLEELLPEFRKGAKIRRADWGKRCYIRRVKGGIVTAKENPYNPTWQDLDSGLWEFYKNPEPDWQYIIDHKCPVWCWDYNESKKHIEILKSINKYETHKFSIVTPDNYVNDISFVNCRPVRRDEVTFYEDKKDDVTNK